MRPTVLRLALTTSVAAAAMVLAGSPDFMALERAVSKVFRGTTPAAATAFDVDTPLFEPSSDRVLELPAVEFPTRELVPELPDPAPGRIVAVPPRQSWSGGRAIIPLYASFITLQVLDVHSTLRAMDRGAVEVNPVMAPFTNRPAAFVAVKAGTAAGILYMTERVRRHSPLAAIIMMGAFNSVYATVVANNYRLVR